MKIHIQSSGVLPAQINCTAEQFSGASPKFIKNVLSRIAGELMPGRAWHIDKDQFRQLCGEVFADSIGCQLPTDDEIRMMKGEGLI